MGCRQPGPDTWGRTCLPARAAGNSGESTGERGGGDSSGPGPAAQAARRRPLVREGPSRSAFSRLKRGSFRPFLSREIRAEEGKGEEPWPGRGRAPIGVVSTLSWALRGRSLLRPRGAGCFHSADRATAQLSRKPALTPPQRLGLARQKGKSQNMRKTNSIRRGALCLPTREMTEMRKPATGAAAVHGAGRDVTPSTPTSSAPGSSWKQRPPPARPGGCGRAGQERRRPPGRSPRDGAQCTWVSIAPCFAGNTAGQSEGKTLKGSTLRT